MSKAMYVQSSGGWKSELWNAECISWILPALAVLREPNHKCSWRILSTQHRSNNSFAVIKQHFGNLELFIMAIHACVWADRTAAVPSHCQLAPAFQHRQCRPKTPLLTVAGKRRRKQRQAFSVWMNAAVRVTDMVLFNSPIVHNSALSPPSSERLTYGFEIPELIPSYIEPSRPSRLRLSQWSSFSTA